MQDVDAKLIPVLQRHELHSEVNNYFQQQIGLNFLEGTSKLLPLHQVVCMVLNIAHCRK